MRRGAAARAHDDERRAADQHATDARPASRLQRIPLGRTHADGRRRDAPPRPVAGRHRGTGRTAAARSAAQTDRAAVSAPPLPPLPPFPRSDWAYFFDIDGTLIDFADTPSSVQVSDEVRRLLERLYQCAGGAVALMSGRTIAEVDRLFPAVQLPVAGQHGVERRNAAGVYSRHAAPTERFEQARDRLTAAIADKPG